MARFEAWEKRLNALVGMYRRAQFEWGKRDCCLLAADSVWALTQRDPAAAWRGTYSSEAAANALLAQNGGLVGIVEAGLASIGIVADRLDPKMGQRGDPCILEQEGIEALGIVYGGGLLAMRATGVIEVPLAAGKCIWAIR